MKSRPTKRKIDDERRGPISLYPLKFEEVVRDVLTMKPPPKTEKRQRSGKRQDRNRQR
jgi:hypothetical protein